jgi:spore coat polysaccharide biosynthesis predicted glycosyltransferase SpsG
MCAADLAITHGGNSLYELAAVGTPAVVLCRRQRQQQNARFFQERGTALSLGAGTEVAAERLRAAVRELAADPARRAAMAAAGRRTVDGDGLARVCRLVAAELALVTAASEAPAGRAHVGGGRRPADEVRA